MEKFLTGLSVAAIGLLVVFVGLCIIIGFIKLLAIFAVGGEKKARKPKPEAKPAAAAPVAAPAPVVAASAEQPGIPGEVLAAITAAISALWDGENGFTVRRVRRVSNAPAWNRAGREEQTYSRL